MGISGLNFKLYDFGNYIDAIIPFTSSHPEKGERFVLSGFESMSFVLNTADILLFYLITLTIASIYLLLYGIFKFNRKAKKWLGDKLPSFKYSAFISLFEASFMVTFLCAYINWEASNSDTLIEML